MAKKAYTGLLLFLLVFPLFTIPVFGIIGPGTVIDDTTNKYSISNPAARSTCYASGRVWVFYGNGSSTLVVKSSTNISDWTQPPIQITNSMWYGVHDVVCEGSYFHVAWITNATYRIYYRMGLFNSDGTITWQAAAQNVYSAYWSVSITLDANDKPVIGYSTSSTIDFYVIRSDYSNGTWYTTSGWPKLVRSNSPARGSVGKVLVLDNGGLVGLYPWYTNSGTEYNCTAKWYNTTLGQFTGQNWTRSQMDLSAMVELGGGWLYNQPFSAVVEGNKIRVSFVNSTGHDLVVATWDWAAKGFTNEELVYDNANENSVPQLMKYGNDLKMFWMEDTDSNVTYSLTRVDDVWGVTPEEISIEVNDTMPYSSQLKVPESAFAGEYWWLVYLTNQTSPYNVVIAPTLNATIPAIDTNSTIPDADFDPYLFVNKFYHFEQTVKLTGVDPPNIDTMSLRFSDGYSTFMISYNNVTDTFSTNSPDFLTLDLHSSSTVKTETAVNHTIKATYIVKLHNTVQDAQNVDLYENFNCTNGLELGWSVAQTDYFNIYNHGGIVESISSGNAGRIQGGDTFEMWAEDGGWVAVNQTWYHLVQYHTQFTIEFSGASDSNDQFMQDCGHYFIPSDKWCSDKGDWQLFISWYYFDQTNMSNKGYVKGWTAWIQMETGNTNQNNHWTSLNVTWFDSQGATVRSDLVWSYAEPPESNQVKIWLDLWFNKVNASTVHGGRVSPVYYGVTFSGFLWWGTFGPLMQNSTQSMLFDENIGKDDVTVVPAQFLEMSKVMFNLTRPTSNILAEDMKVTLKNFDISEFKTTDGRVLGIDTPIYVYPKIPDLPVEGFFAPLYKAISMIGQYIQDAINDGLAIIWDGIEARFPWFTTFWENMVGTIVSISSLFNAIWTYVVSFFLFLGSIIGYISYPFQVLAQAWSYVQQMFSWVSGADLTNLLIIFIIIFTFIPILQALYAGNWDFIIGFVNRIWAVAYRIFMIAYDAVTMVIGWIIQLIRG